MRDFANPRVLVTYLSLRNGDERLYPCLHAQLTAEEQVRAARYTQASDRLAFAAGRALVRTTLSRIASAPPGGWRFLRGRNGKPQMEPHADLQFSISHTSGMVAAAAAVGRAVGVDVESKSIEISISEIAKDWFAPSEQALLASLAGEARREAFFSLWTLREAYAKARGEGLSQRLTQTIFKLEPPAILSSQEGAEEETRWDFRFLHQQEHLLAAAVEKRSSETPEVVIEAIEMAALACLSS